MEDVGVAKLSVLLIDERKYEEEEENRGRRCNAGDEGAFIRRRCG
jgi:hypothetical protein